MNVRRKVTQGLPASIIAKAKGIYAIRRLVPNYTGACCRLVRSSDSAEMDVAFLANGKADVASTLAWLGASYGRVSVWYDQSGHGYHMTQTSATIRPTWEPYGQMQELGGIGPRTTVYGNIPADLNFPAELTTDGRDVSVTQVFIGDDKDQNSYPIDQPRWQLGTESTTGCIYYCEGYYTVATAPANGDRRMKTVSAIGGQFRNSGTTLSMLPANCGPVMQTFTSTTAGTRFRTDGRVSTAAAGNVFSGTGGRWGRCYGTTFYGPNCIGMAVVITTALTETEESGLHACLRGMFSTSVAKNLLVADGDSIISGHTTALSVSLPSKSAPYAIALMLGRTWQCYNRGWSGGSLTTGQTKDRFAPAPDSVDSIINTQYSGKKVLILFVGTNDIKLGTAEATIKSQVQAYCEARRAAGFKVITSSIPKRKDFTVDNETVRQNYNAWLAANYATFSDAFADIASWDWSANSYATWTQDGIHPNDACVARMRDTYLPLVLSL